MSYTQRDADQTSSERVFKPGKEHSIKRDAILLMAFSLTVILYLIPDIVSILVFIVFTGIFFSLYLFFVKRDREGLNRLRPLRFSPSGLHHESLASTYGVNTIPWAEIRALDIFYGSNGVDIPGPGPRWLRIYLHDGPFRQRITKPISDRIFGGDVNILMQFDTSYEVILSEALAFHARFALQH